MGCGASSEQPAASVTQSRAPLEYHYGQPDISCLGSGVDKSEVTTRAAFEHGKSTLYLLSTAARQKEKMYPTDNADEDAGEKEKEKEKEKEEEKEKEKEEGADNTAEEAKDGDEAKENTQEYPKEQDGEEKKEDEKEKEEKDEKKSEGAHQVDKEAEAAATPSSMKKNIPSVRWAIYNDGKAEARITCTYFHAEDIKVIAGDAAEEKRMPNNSLQVKLKVPALATVPFVEGPIGGYMWKCEVMVVEGTYSLAKTYEEARA